MKTANHRAATFAAATIALLFTLSIWACQKAAEPAPASAPAPSAPAAPAQPAGPMAAPQPTIPPEKPAETTAPPPSPTPFVKVTRHYDGVGVILKINAELGSVELNHEEIKGLMPAMTMEYYVDDKAMLKAIKVGDTVDFTVKDVSGAETISAITPRAQGKK